MGHFPRDSVPCDLAKETVTTNPLPTQETGTRNVTERAVFSLHWLQVCGARQSAKEITKTETAFEGQADPPCKRQAVFG